MPVVSKSRPSTRRRKALQEPARELKVSTHALVPKHQVLPPGEAQEILSRYHATLSQFPYILATDPVVTEIGAKPGDIVKVTRDSETAGQSVYYRVVVGA